MFVEHTEVLADLDPRLDDLQDLDMMTGPPVNVDFLQQFLDIMDEPSPAASATVASPRQPSPAAAVSPRQPSPAPSAADNESADDAMECFVSSLVDDHVSTMMFASIGVAVMETERQLQLKLRGAMWDIAMQLTIVFLASEIERQMPLFCSLPVLRLTFFHSYR